MEIKSIVVVGLGGTGSCVIKPLLRFLNYSKKFKGNIVLVDGDSFELKNEDRQEFDIDLPLNKAENWGIRLSDTFKNLKIGTVSEYLTEKNAQLVLTENSLVISCVDNHSTRNLLQSFCLKVRSCILISSGNDYSDGNVQYFARENGKNLTPTIDKYHEEIKFPTDKSPHEMSCEELAESSPQLLFANFMSAGIILSTFYCLFNGKKCFEEVYFDIEQQAAKGVSRK